jgi:hypothetical protein
MDINERLGRQLFRLRDERGLTVRNLWLEVRAGKETIDITAGDCMTLTGAGAVAIRNSGKGDARCLVASVLGS